MAKSWGIYEDIMRNADKSLVLLLSTNWPLTPFALKPEMTFKSDVLPAPEGPRMAVRRPDLKLPHVSFRILEVFDPNKRV